MMVNCPAARPLDYPVTVAMGGAPPSPTLLARMQELHFEPIHLYGLTETYGPIAICTWPDEWNNLPPEEQARLRARQGQGYITAEEVRVVDRDGRDVPCDGETLGEVALRGNTIMKGYYQQPEATAILECAVVAMPHDKWGERPKAFVALKDGHSADEAAIIAFCREQLAHFKCPDAVAFGPLPKTSTGKVQKYVLREREWEGRERRIN